MAATPSARRRERARRRARRGAIVAAGLAAATSLIGTFQVAVAPSALAFCSVYDPCSGTGGDGGSGDPGPGPMPEPAPTVPPPDTGGSTPGGGGGGSPDGDKNSGFPGYDKSQALLNNAPCNNLITGNNPAGGQDATTVLQNATFVTHNQPNPTYPNALAVASLGNDGTRYIDYYPAYIFASSNTIYGVLAPGARLSRPLTFEEVQAVAQLHEVAHHTGANVHAEGDPGAAFNLWIVNQCLGVTVTFP